MSDTAADQLFLGRQPILDREQRLVAYELLFRNGTRNSAEVTDGVQATATVIANAFSELGVEAALGNCRGFINVDEAFLFSDMLELLPRHAVVLEILETVPPSAAVVERCAALKAAGFTLALDDVIQLEPEFADLLGPGRNRQGRHPAAVPRPADATGDETDTARQAIAGRKSRFARTNGTMPEAWLHAFPGLLLRQTDDHRRQKLDHSQLSLMKLMGLLLSDADSSELEAALKPEPGLTVNLLRMTNSVGSGSTEKITSLRHAITVLGRRQLQRWLQLLVFASGSQNGSTNPLLLMAATRGRLLELIAEELRPGDGALADQAFMTGIMSLMPALVGQPIDEIVAPLGLASSVRDALCDSSGALGGMLRIAENSENGELEQLANNLAHLPGLGPKALNRAQTQALQWANSIGQDAPTA